MENSMETTGITGVILGLYLFTEEDKARLNLGF